MVEKGVVLDGFPRTVPQAKALLGMVKVERYIVLEAPDAVLAERATGRRMDPETGEIYNLLSMPAPADAASRLVVRPADADAQAFALRLSAYAALQKSITPLFEAEGCLVRLIARDDAATMHSQIVVATAHPVAGSSALMTATTPCRCVASRLRWIRPLHHC